MQISQNGHYQRRNYALGAEIDILNYGRKRACRSAFRMGPLVWSRTLSHFGVTLLSCNQRQYRRADSKGGEKR